MKLKHSAILVLLVPAMAMVSACNRDNDADDMAAPPAATTPADDSAAPVVDDSTAPAADATTAAATDTTAPAPATDASAGMTFEDMDKNGDGGVSPDELPPTDMLYGHFAAADADGNGMLSADEIIKHRADMAAPATPPAQ
jgi:hypothetical protein